MRDTQRIDTSMIRRTVLTLATLAVAISMTACSHAMMMIHGTGAKRPAASEFGLGPRVVSGRPLRGHARACQAPAPSTDANRPRHRSGC